MNNFLTYQYKNFLKVLFIVFSILLIHVIEAQNVLQNQTEFVNIQLASVEEIATILEDKYKLKEKKITLEQSYEIESLTGKHIDFTCFYDGVSLKDVFIKVHVNSQNQIFFIQENISKISRFKFENNQINKAKILRNLKSIYTVNHTQDNYVFQQNSFIKSFQVRLFNEQNDIYIEREYFNENSFEERDLKVHFAPIDTTLYGKVFQPDPLSSAHESYGGNYQDAITKDTTVLIVNRIANTGQSNIISNLDSFTLYGLKFGVTSVNFPNSYTGDTVYYYFQDIYLNGDGEILGYNAILSDDLSGLKTEIKVEDYDFEELNAEQYHIEVQGDYAGTKFQLRNSVFEIVDFSPPMIDPVALTTNDFSFKRSHNGFEDINAFYHLNNYHNYIEELGFITLDPEKLIIDAHGNNGGDNSYFVNSPSPRLVFGDGGVDDAEDAAVVIHEYTHALSNFASPNTNVGQERRALDEALGDYISSSYSTTYGEYNKGLVFPWDGHNEFWDGRISNSDSTYLSIDTASNSIYVNGEIMSATLMDIFDEIGKDVTDKLVLESMFYNVKYNTFLDVANNLLFIDSLLFDNEHKCAIFDVLVKRKFKEGFCIGKSLVFANGFHAINTAEFANNSGFAEFYIVEENFEKMDVWISNALGQIVYERNDITDPKIELDPADFNDGIYYVRIQTNNEKYLTKLVK